MCDERSKVTGTVRRDDGSSFNTDARAATVQALDLDDGGVTASAALDPSGRYTLTLSPGRYLVKATVLDATGTHTGDAPDVLTVGCTAGTSTLDLTTAPLTPQPSSALTNGGRQ